MSKTFRKAGVLLSAIGMIAIMITGVSFASTGSQTVELTRVFVTFDAPVGPAEQAFLARQGGEVHHTFPTILPATISVTLPGQAIDALRHNSHVVTIEEVQEGPVAQRRGFRRIPRIRAGTSGIS